jgi:hypothetical protein
LNKNFELIKNNKSNFLILNLELNKNLDLFIIKISQKNKKKLEKRFIFIIYINLNKKIRKKKLIKTQKLIKIYIIYKKKSNRILLVNKNEPNDGSMPVVETN